MKLVNIDIINDAEVDPVQCLIDFVNNQHLAITEENVDIIQYLCNEIAKKYKKPRTTVLIIDRHIQVNEKPIEVWLKNIME